jgi:ribosomal protein S13
MNHSKNNISGLVAEIADQIINEMSIKDRIKMANLDESQISKTNQLLILYIEGKLKILSSRQETNGIYEIPLDEIDSIEATLIVNEIWKRLRKTHRLKVVE